LVRVDPASGYPVGDDGPDTASALTNNDCVRIFNDLLRHDYSVSRRDDVNNNNFRNFDVIVTRSNANPDICNYYLSASLTARPNVSFFPGIGIGFRYFAGTGQTQAFSF
jgi:hypothetical protein